MPNLLANLSTAEFMRDYWQKKPLLIRGAVPEFRSPLSRDELAGLALEQEIESRLVFTEDGPKYRLENGPFSSDRLSSLPSSDWTLLVQDVDKFLPDVAQFRELVSFIPFWRFDDIMISYAADGGSVGAHVDLYDVFLLQAQGSRRWEIDTRENPDLTYDPNQELRVLQKFNPTEEWVLEPGDALYLPPGVPHHGVALGDCMTWSFGFRAPSFADLGGAVLAEICADWDREHLYSDADLGATTTPGEMNPAALNRLKVSLLKKLEEYDWSHHLATALSESKPHCQPEGEPTPIQAGVPLRVDPATRFGYLRSGERCDLYANGERVAQDIPTEFARALCSPSLTVTWPEEVPDSLLSLLLERGYLYY